MLSAWHRLMQPIVAKLSTWKPFRDNVVELTHNNQHDDLGLVGCGITAAVVAPIWQQDFRYPEVPIRQIDRPFPAFPGSIYRFILGGYVEGSYKLAVVWVAFRVVGQFVPVHGCWCRHIQRTWQRNSITTEHSYVRITWNNNTRHVSYCKLSVVVGQFVPVHGCWCWHTQRAWQRYSITTEHSYVPITWNNNMRHVSYC